MVGTRFALLKPDRARKERRICMNFRWHMLEKDFKRLQKALKSEKEESDNVYGGFGSGRIYIDILTYGKGYFTENEKGNVLCANAYVAGIDTGYGYFDDGTPYDLVYNGMDLKNIKTTGSFTDFKISCEKEFMRVVNDDPCCDEWIKYSDSEFVKAWYEGAA